MSDSDDGEVKGRGVPRRARRDDTEDGEEPGKAEYGMTAFNMNDEKEEGHFDENGTFVWNAEDKKVQEEAWLEDISEEQMDKALNAKNRREYQDEQSAETMTKETAKRTLATLLNPRETVLQALQRLGSKKKKNRGTKRKQAHMNGKAEAPEQTAEQKEQFEKITEAADFLMRRGDVDVYSEMKEEFIPEEELIAQRQAAAPRARVSFADSTQATAEQEGKSEEKPPPEVMWEYKGADGQIHGPFPTSSVVAWQQQGYFKGDSAVEIRQAGGSDGASGSASAAADALIAPEKEEVSAEQELLNDFEDSDEEAEQGADKQGRNDWVSSDSVDFSKY